MEEFIQNYGYWAVFLGSCIEGESIVLTAGFLASKGYLSLIKIMILSFVGTLLADQGLYWLGRRYGMAFLEKRPHWHQRVEKAMSLLHKYNTIYILSFRFIYGIRIISPIIIGACGIPVARFTILNFIAAFIWSVSICLIGYFFGEIWDPLTAYIESNIDFILMILLGVCAGLIGFYYYSRKKRK